MNDIEYNRLIVNLAAEQVNVLKAIKPDAKARATWNRALQAVVDSLPQQYQAKVRKLFLEVSI